MQGDRLVIRNNAAELRRMTQWLCDSAAATAVPEDVVFKLDFCANEAVSNIIFYAYEPGRQSEIVLELNKTENGARLVIRDDGKPFNLLEVSARQLPGSLEEAGIGGLGIHLIRGMVTHCDYRRADGVNVLCFEAEHEPRSGNA